MKVDFLTELRVEKVGPDTWRLLEPLIIWTDSSELMHAYVEGVRGHTLTVPAGFEHDFASVPRIPVAYWLAGNTAHKSAVVHDYLYAVKAPRGLADRVFKAAMVAEGVPAWRRALMYSAVRAFGHGYYMNREEAEIWTP
jgi:hypothetical protein